MCGKLLTGLDRISEDMNNPGFSGDKGEVCWSCWFPPSKQFHIVLRHFQCAAMFQSDFNRLEAAL